MIMSFMIIFSFEGKSVSVQAQSSDLGFSGGKYNGLTIALDTLRSSDTPQVLINFMKQHNYNALRIYMGWCSSFYTGDVNNPMDSRTQNFLDELYRLCAENDFLVVSAISAQVTPFRTAFPEEIQVGYQGGRNSQDNWMCPSGPNFRTFSKNLVTILVNIMEKYATPRISVDEIVFVSGGGTPTFYSQSMQTAYRQATGQNIPAFTSTSGSYSSSQRQFIDFATEQMRSYFQLMENTANQANPNVVFGALVDTYWVYPRTSYDTQPWDFYATVDEIVYEWFYATQEENWAGITDGLQRIKNINPNALHYFIYGTSTMTSINNMRKTVELVMAQDYDGVFLYEYAKSKSNPFDVSDIVKPSTTPIPTPTPTPTPTATPTPTPEPDYSPRSEWRRDRQRAYRFYRRYFQYYRY